MSTPAISAVIRYAFLEWIVLWLVLVRMEWPTEDSSSLPVIILVVSMLTLVWSTTERMVLLPPNTLQMAFINSLLWSVNLRWLIFLKLTLMIVVRPMSSQSKTIPSVWKSSPPQRTTLLYLKRYLISMTSQPCSNDPISTSISMQLTECQVPTPSPSSTTFSALPSSLCITVFPSLYVITIIVISIPCITITIPIPYIILVCSSRIGLWRLSPRSQSHLRRRACPGDGSRSNRPAQGHGGTHSRLWLRDRRWCWPCYDFGQAVFRESFRFTGNGGCLLPVYSLLCEGIDCMSLMNNDDEYWMMNIDEHWWILMMNTEW